MKILVLGHKGMLGTDLMSRLGGHSLTGKDVDDFDITSASDCRDIIDESRPDIVINAAAFTDVDGCETREETAFAVNAEGVKNVALACREDNTRIIHFSTDYVFDGTSERPYKEDDRCNPINAYGRSKYQGELYLKEFSKNYILIRTSWLYGRHGKNFVKAILQRAKNSQTLEVVTDQVGSPTFTADLAGAVKVLAEGGHTGTFNVTNRGSCSWYEFARRILDLSGFEHVEIKPITSEFLERKALRPKNSMLSGEKFASATGKTLRFWQVALRDYLELPV
jgi:dTDP-4-dehydrorhamnose reductase